MGILAHIHDLHFANFMNNPTIITFVKYRWQRKYRIKHFSKHFRSTHQAGQPLYIVKNTPGVMPAVTFSKGVSPFEWIEGRLKTTVLIFATHQAGCTVE